MLLSICSFRSLMPCPIEIMSTIEEQPTTTPTQSESSRLSSEQILTAGVQDIGKSHACPLAESADAVGWAIVCVGASSAAAEPAGSPDAQSSQSSSISCFLAFFL